MRVHINNWYWGTATYRSHVECLPSCQLPKMQTSVNLKCLGWLGYAGNFDNPTVGPANICAWFALQHGLRSSPPPLHNSYHHPLICLDPRFCKLWSIVPWILATTISFINPWTSASGICGGPGQNERGPLPGDTQGASEVNRQVRSYPKPGGFLPDARRILYSLWVTMNTMPTTSLIYSC